MSGRSSEKRKKNPRSRRAAEQYKFDDLDAVELLLALIIGQVLQGGAMRVGLTRDEGALAIGVYQNDEYGTEYVRPTEDLAMLVRQIAMDWEIELALWDDEAGQWRLP